MLKLDWPCELTRCSSRMHHASLSAGMPSDEGGQGLLHSPPSERSDASQQQLGLGTYQSAAAAEHHDSGLPCRGKKVVAESCMLIAAGAMNLQGASVSLEVSPTSSTHMSFL